MRRIRATVGVAMLLTGWLVIGCGTSATYSDIMAAGGWPGMRGTAHNSGASTADGPRSPAPAWSRALGGTPGAPASISGDGQLFVSARLDSGCNLFAYELKSGRQRFCDVVPFTTPKPGRIIATPILDPDANAYIGIDDGTMRSYDDRGRERWVMPVFGAPQSAQFTADGNVLEVTQFGEINVFDRQTGKRLIPPLRLLGQPDRATQPNLPWPANDQGLDDCETGKSGCPVATSPALDPKSGRFYVTLWRPGASAASVVAMHYRDGTIGQDWSVDVLPAGTVTSPTLSNDGSVVYVADNAGNLIAIDAADGKTRWTHHLGYPVFGGISVSGSGLIMPGGAGAGSRLVALRDNHDHAEIAWQRRDLIQLGVPAFAAGSTGYTVIRTETDPTPTLLTFNTADGSTLAQNPLPAPQTPAPQAPAPAGQAAGDPGQTVGTAVGPAGEVVVTSRNGTLYTFKKPS